MSEEELEFDKLFAELGNKQSPASAAKDASIKRECADSLEPRVSLSRTQRVAACAGLGLIVIGSLAVLWRDDGVHQLTQSALYGAAGWAMVLLSVLLIGFGPPGARTLQWRVGAAVGVPVMFFGYLGICQSSWMPLSEFLTHPAHCMNAFRCGAMALGLGALSAAGVLYVWRRTDPFQPEWSGALAGLVGGLCGALSIGLVCPGTEAWHLWLGHGLSVVALVLVGAKIGRRVLAP